MQWLMQTMPRLLQNLNINAIANWGVMQPQEMVEHLDDFFQVSAGKIHYDILTAPEQLPSYRAFLLSNKMFRENIKAPNQILGNKPNPLRTPNLA